MKKFHFEFTRDEVQDLWFAVAVAEEDAHDNGHYFTEKDLGKLREKLYKVLTNEGE